MAATAEDRDGLPLKVPVGATGFGSPGGQIGSEEVRAFLTACHDAARRTRGVVAASRKPGATSSFHSVVISYDSDQVAVLRHDRLPVIAFAQPVGPTAQVFSFIDCDPLGQLLGQVNSWQP
jgi:hypothetical protein